MADPEHDARLILARVHRATYQNTTYAAEHKSAATELVGKFIELASVQGLKHFRTDGQHSRDALSLGTFKAGVTFFVASDGEVQLRLEGHNTVTGVPHTAPLEYDPLTKTLVGTEVDADIAPKPGERLPRVPAMVVLARLVEQLAVAAAR